MAPAMASRGFRPPRTRGARGRARGRGLRARAAPGGGEEARDRMAAARKYLAEKAAPPEEAGPGAGPVYDALARRAERANPAQERPAELPEVEIISVEPNYNPAALEEERAQLERAAGAEAGAASTSAEGAAVEEATEGAGGDEKGNQAYNPSVSTWGMFPRPKDISRAYGGGRTLRPGQALEPEEATKARAARAREALAAYKKKAGLIIDPEEERKAREFIAEASQLESLGRYSQAAERYEKASEVLPFATDITAEALLGRGLCLDSLGQEAQAREVYGLLSGHPNRSFARKASQMLFGFDAANDLGFGSDKASYVVGSDQYSPLFRPIVEEGGFYEADADADTDDGFALVILLALALLLLPVVVVAAQAAIR